MFQRLYETLQESGWFTPAFAAGWVAFFAATVTADLVAGSLPMGYLDAAGWIGISVLEAYAWTSILKAVYILSVTATKRLSYG